jgi:hypothetical protein
MEYLSKVCTQLQNNELNGKVRSKQSPPKQTVSGEPTVAVITVQHQDSAMHKEQNILAFVAELESMFDRVNALVARTDTLSIEEQQEVLKVTFILSFGEFKLSKKNSTSFCVYRRRKTKCNRRT